MFEGTAAAAAADAGDDEDEDDEAFLDFFCPSALCDQEPLAASSFSKSLSLSPLSSSLVLPLGKVVTGGGSTGSAASATACRSNAGSSARGGT